jgi:hypothetical protein
MELDLLMLPYIFLGFCIRNIHSGNPTKVYESGMKEDLSFFGNQFQCVQLQTVNTVAYTVFMISLMLLAARYRNIMPVCDLLRGIFNLLQNRAQSSGGLSSYRFFIGVFEIVPFSFPSTIRCAPGTEQMNLFAGWGSSTFLPV